MNKEKRASRASVGAAHRLSIASHISNNSAKGRVAMRRTATMDAGTAQAAITQWASNFKPKRKQRGRKSKSGTQSERNTHRRKKHKKHHHKLKHAATMMTIVEGGD